jgi:hypothetical protein
MANNRRWRAWCLAAVKTLARPQRALFGDAPTLRSRAKPSYRMLLEQLEDRTLLQAAPGWLALGPQPQTDPTNVAGLGPNQNVSGRVTSLAVVTNGLDEPAAMILGSASGGLWWTDTLQAGAAPAQFANAPIWQAVGNNITTLGSNSIGSIAVVPPQPGSPTFSDIVFAGTGEANYSGDSTPGCGILRSADGGVTWTLIATGTVPGNTAFVGQAISKIIATPDGHVFAAVVPSGYLNPPSPADGVYESDITGHFWQKLPLPGPIVTDLEYTSVGGNINLYAAVGDPGNAPGLGPVFVPVDAAATGIYQSIADPAHALGQNWVHVFSPANAGLIAGQAIGRISLAADHFDVAALQPAMIYAAMANGDSLLEVASSPNGNIGSWTPRVGPFLPPGALGLNPEVSQAFGSQASYDLSIGIDPTNPNTIYLGGQSYVARSTDSGLNWSRLDVPGGNPIPHTDHHAWAFTGSVAYDGNDGGIFKFQPAVGMAGGTWVDMNTGAPNALGTLQVNAVATNGVAGAGQVLLAGSQDNGTVRNTPAQGTAWNTVDRGDGGQIRFAPINKQIAYEVSDGQSNRFTFAVSNDGGNTWPLATNGIFDSTPGPTYGGPRPLIDPVFPFAPVFAVSSTNDHHVALTANNGVWLLNVTNDGLVPIGPPWPIAYNWTNVTGNLAIPANSTITAASYAANSDSTVYVGYSNGEVFRTRNINAAVVSWQRIDPQINSWRLGSPVTSITTTNGIGGPNVYLTLGGVGPGGKVYRVSDPAVGTIAGTNLTGAGIFALPNNAVVNTLAVDNRGVGTPPTSSPRLFVGTNMGVFMRAETAGIGGAVASGWILYGTGLPVVTVKDLQIDNTNEQLFAATYGRGVYSIPLPPLVFPGGGDGEEGEDTTVKLLTEEGTSGTGPLQSGTVSFNSGDGVHIAVTSGETESFASSSGSTGTWTVFGTNIYQDAGTYNALATFIPTSGGPPLIVPDEVTITEAPLTQESVYNLSGTVGSALSNVTVAKFQDQDSSSTTSDFATPIIDWGDGTTSPGHFGTYYNDGYYTVLGSHSYLNPGDYTIYVYDWETDSSNYTNTSITASITGPITITPVTINATEGELLNNILVARFTDANPPSSLSLYTVYIYYGDGQDGLGTVSYDNGTNGSNGYDVKGTHTYEDPGAMPVKVVVNNPDEYDTGESYSNLGSASSTSTTNVLDADLTWATLIAEPPALQNYPLENYPIGSFIDGNPLATPSDFQVSVNGDPTIAKIVQGPGPENEFYVLGGNLEYSEPGQYDLAIDIQDDGGNFLDANSTVDVTSTAPVLDSIDPTSVSKNGGALIELEGSSFTNITHVSLNGTPLSTSSYTTSASGGSIAVMTPAVSSTASSVTESVTVTNDSGTSSPQSLTFVDSPVPLVTGLSLPSGLQGSGTQFIINGSGFSGSATADQVTFIDPFGVRIPAESVVVISDTQLRVTAPVTSLETYDVAVTTAGGTAAITPADKFTFVQGTVALTGVQPASGPTAGGNPVTLTGRFFGSVQSVWFGSTPATSFTVNSDTSITAIPPVSAAGAVNVSVSTTANVVNTWPQYTFNADSTTPAITGLSTGSGPMAGATSVSISGTMLSGATAVFFGGQQAVITSDTPTLIVATSPSGTGTVDITVVTSRGISPTSGSIQFTYNGVTPVVSGLSPNSGTDAGGDAITISGSYFTGATAVSFGGAAAASFTVDSDTQITAVTPADTGTVDVTVTGPHGTSSTSSADLFTFEYTPVISSLSATSGTSVGGTTVTIGGSYFAQPLTVKFGPFYASSVTVNSSSSITVTSPAAFYAGWVDVSVITTAGQSVPTSADQFEYIDHFAVSAPSTVTAGTGFAFTVTTLDSSNNPLTSFNGAVIFSTDSSSIMPSPTTLTSGVGIFSATLMAAGSQSLTVSEFGTFPGGSIAFLNVIPGPANQFVLGIPAVMTTGTAIPLTVTALDAFGNIATGYLGTVQFSSGDSAAALPASATLTSGTGLFSATLNTYGTQNITATDSISTSPSGAATITVVPASTNHFGLSVANYVTAGSATVFTVTAYTASNAVDTSYNGTVAFASSDNGASTVLPTTDAMTSGVGIFTATLTTAGNQSLTSTGEFYILNTCTTAINVSAGPATHLVAFAPNSIGAGSQFVLMVIADDQFNNIATGYTGTVHFDSANDIALLPADSTLTAGRGLFFVSLQTAGTEHITVSDTVNSTITGASQSISLVVYPGPITHFGFNAPAIATPGVWFGFTVFGQDAYNNTVTSYSGLVDFSSSDINATLPNPPPASEPNSGTMAGGQGTFSATLQTSGVQTITVTDNDVPSLTGSFGISVNVNAATRFEITAPTDATADYPFPLTVTALDPYNNVFQGYTGTVHFTSNDGLADLPSDRTLNAGIGTFTATLASGGTETISAAEINHGDVNGSASVNVTGGVTTHFAVTFNSGTMTAGVSFRFTVTAEDVNNNPAVGYTGLVHFSSTDSGALLPIDKYLTHGTRVLTATLTTAGNQLLTISDTSNGTLTWTSSTIPVVAAPANHYALSAPANATAGTRLGFTVTARDPFNNTDTGYSGFVTFTSTDAQAALPGGATLSNGAGTFSTTLGSSGNQTLIATDTATSGITGTSGAIVVSPTTVDHFAIGTYSAGTAGGPFSFTVIAQDKYNNTVPSYTGSAGTVSFHSGDSSAAVPANSTLTSGVGTFTATLKTAGNETLIATDASHTTTTGSATVAVGANAPSQFLVQAPASAVAGTGFSFTVSTEDQFNNFSPGYFGTVHFTGSDSLGVMPADAPLVSGIGTFSATLKTAANQSLTATDNNTSGLTGTITGVSGAIAVGPAQATHFTTGVPSTTTAGAGNNITLTFLDQFNNQDTNYYGVVQFSTSDPQQGEMPANYTFYPTDHGQHNFGFTLFTAGEQTVTVASSLVGGAPVTSSPIAVSPTLANHFAVTNTGTATAGTSFAVTVTAEDTFYNVAPSYAGTVSLSAIGDTGITFAQTSTFTNGVGTFNATLFVAVPNNLRSYTYLTATDTAGHTGLGDVILVSPLAATHFGITAPANSTAGSVFAFTVTAMDPYNNTATSYNGSVHFAGSDGQGVLPANTSVANGVGTFSATLKTAANQSLTATDTVTSSISGHSAAITVNPAAATHFSVMSPSSVTAGSESFYFTVTALDSFNNTATGYTGTAHFSSSTSGDHLPTDIFLPSSGTAVFNAILYSNAGGAHTLTVTDSVVGSITGRTGAITVNPGPAAHLSISAPSNSTAGHTISVSVTATDEYGNLATAFADTVHFTTTDTNYVDLPADYTFTGAAQHTVTGPTLATAGPQTVTVSDVTNSGVTAGTTGTITVSPEAANHFRIDSPQWTTAGTAIAFTVTAQDTFFNLVPGYSGTVSFSSSDTHAATKLPGSTVLTSGVGVFSVTLTTSGGQSIVASDGTIGTSSPPSVNVSPLAATHFGIKAPANSTAGGNFAFTVTALDTYNNPATGYNGTVHFSSNNTEAGLQASGTLSSGAGTFSASLVVAGSQQIIATDSASTSTTGSNTLTVAAAGATHLVIETFSSDVTAGDTIVVTVLAEDQYGNLAPSDTSAVDFSSTDPNAIVPTGEGLSSGAMTVGVTLTTAGSQTITASGGGGLNATSSAITVNAGGLAQFIFPDNPGSATYGESFTITVVAADAYGNLVASFSGEVTWTTDASGTFGFTYVSDGSGNPSRGITINYTALGSGDVATITATDTATGTVTGVFTVTLSNPTG